MKRFSFDAEVLWDGVRAYMREDRYGDYVLYEDFEAELDSCKTQLLETETALEELNEELAELEDLYDNALKEIARLEAL